MRDSKSASDDGFWMQQMKEATTVESRYRDALTPSNWYGSTMNQDAKSLYHSHHHITHSLNDFTLLSTQRSIRNPKAERINASSGRTFAKDECR
jgi:hypothetical protein